MQFEYLQRRRENDPEDRFEVVLDNNFLKLMKSIKPQILRSFISMLLQLLSRFSRVRLCATPWTAFNQASLSLGFSRQEHWSGLPFPSPMHESEK